MTMTHIRREAGDAPAIRRVHEAAFLRAKEADIVEGLVAARAVSLSLVAVQGSDVVGHILFSPVTIDNVQVRAVGLAPMAILPAYQRQGIGSALVRAALDELRRVGHDAVVVLGHPAYYPRFGFRRASEFGLRWESDCPDEAFMALELQPGALAGRSGVVRYRPELG
jgi:putative acetyltransferase